MLNMSTLPSKPGVYIFRDQQGKALYVGKAINLKNRVKSYFQKAIDLGPKTTLMVSKIKKIEHIVVESEIEALLLEVDLIKRLKPKYNKQWKDDKNYKYIKVTTGDFAKITTSRIISDKKAKYFGPFPEGRTVNQVLRTLRRVFPFRDCSVAKFKRYQRLERPCLYGDLRLCPAPCVGRINTKDYKKIVRQLKRFLSGKSKLVVKELEKEMKGYSKSKEFEKAGLVRDRIRNYGYVTQSFRQASEYLEHPDLLEDRRRRELEELGRELKFASTSSSAVHCAPPLTRIEAYDISNISGQHATGSLVVFVDGEPSKRDYRRFKIKTVERADDVGMMKEIVKRRLARIDKRMSADKSFAKVPDLILIDGGKAQVNTVNEVLKEYGLEIPVLGLTKKFEEIIKSDLSIVRLPKDSPALHLLQRIRDEAHRFAVSYHRKLRDKKMRNG